jgi:hypothetical protein
MKNDLKTSKPKTREEWLLRFTELARPEFKKAGHPLPKKLRCSVGWPSKGKRSQVIGECWQSSATADKVHEIFIRPSLQSETSRIADVLTHELCHAALPDKEGHGKLFRHLATSLGLTGKMTATTAGPAWHAWADPILKQLGKFPAARLGDEVQLGGKKKQTTRMIKLSCDSCDWTCRTSRVHIHDELSCPTGCGGELRED